MTRKVILVCLLMLFAAVPSTGQQSGTAGVGAKPRYGTWGADLTAIDRSVKPGDSFWHFVNGSWDRRTEIPADRTNAGVSVLLVEETERQVRAIVEDLARYPDKAGRAGRQVGDFYASWMDTAAIEAIVARLLEKAHVSALPNDLHRVEVVELRLDGDAC